MFISGYADTENVFYCLNSRSQQSVVNPSTIDNSVCLCFSLITTMVNLMWASLDMITLDSLLEVFKDQSLIRIWTAILFTLYHAASLIVLLNMLIAMMSNSYQRVEVSFTCKKNGQTFVLSARHGLGGVGKERGKFSGDRGGRKKLYPSFTPGICLPISLWFCS